MDNDAPSKVTAIVTARNLAELEHFFLSLMGCPGFQSTWLQHSFAEFSAVYQFPSWFLESFMPVAGQTHVTLMLSWASDVFVECGDGLCWNGEPKPEVFTYRSRRPSGAEFPCLESLAAS